MQTQESMGFYEKWPEVSVMMNIQQDEFQNVKGDKSSRFSDALPRNIFFLSSHKEHLKKFLVGFCGRKYVSNDQLFTL